MRWKIMSCQESFFSFANKCTQPTPHAHDQGHCRILYYYLYCVFIYHLLVSPFTATSNEARSNIVEPSTPPTIEIQILYYSVVGACSFSKVPSVF